MVGRLVQPSLSAWIFIGLGMGTLFGLFFGELCRPLDFVGLIVVFAFTFAFPVTQTSSFFSISERRGGR
jgi:hypothetical protein